MFLLALSMTVAAEAAPAEPAAAPPAAAPIVLVCTGSGVETTSTLKQGGGFDHDHTPIDFTHQVEIDPAGPKVTFDGYKMVVRSFTETEIVFALLKKSLLTTFVAPVTVYTIDRRTGAFRYDAGSGRCVKAADQPKLF